MRDGHVGTYTFIHLNLLTFRRRRVVELAGAPQFGSHIRARGSCIAGADFDLKDLDFFRRPLVVRMHTPSALNGRRVIARGSDEGRLRDVLFGTDETIDETDTQKAVVTLKRLAG